MKLFTGCWQANGRIRINRRRDALCGFSSKQIMTVNETNFEIIVYKDKYARDTVKMWRDSKTKAIGQKDIHSFEDKLSFLQAKLVKENKVFLAIDKEFDR